MPVVHGIVSPSTRSLKVCLSVMKRYASSAVVSSVKTPCLQKSPDGAHTTKFIAELIALAIAAKHGRRFRCVCRRLRAFCLHHIEHTEEEVVVAQGFRSGGPQPLADALQPEYEGILVGERTKVDIHRVLWQTRRHIFCRIQTLEVQEGSSWLAL